MGYTDDINIVGLNNRAVLKALSCLEKEAQEIDLVVNEGEKKYLKATHSFLPSCELRRCWQL